MPSQACEQRSPGPQVNNNPSYITTSSLPRYRKNVWRPWVFPSLRISAEVLTRTAPPPPSAAELRAQEQEATLTIQKIIVGAIMLYLCGYSRLVSFGLR